MVLSASVCVCVEHSHTRKRRVQWRSDVMYCWCVGVFVKRKKRKKVDSVYVCVRKKRQRDCGMKHTTVSG